MRFSLSLGMEQIHIRILAFYGPGAALGILNRRSGLRPSGFTWQVTLASLAGDVIQVWINSSPSNHCISHFKAQLAQLFLIQHLICTYWIKGILCGYAIRSGRHPSGSQRPGPTCGRPLTSLGMFAWPYRVTTKYSYYIWGYFSEMRNTSHWIQQRIYLSFYSGSTW